MAQDNRLNLLLIELEYISNRGQYEDKGWTLQKIYELRKRIKILNK